MTTCTRALRPSHWLLGMFFCTFLAWSCASDPDPEGMEELTDNNAVEGEGNNAEGENNSEPFANYDEAQSENYNNDGAYGEGEDNPTSDLLSENASEDENYAQNYPELGDGDAPGYNESGDAYGEGEEALAENDSGNAYSEDGENYGDVAATGAQSYTNDAGSYDEALEEEIANNTAGDLLANESAANPYTDSLEPGAASNAYADAAFAQGADSMNATAAYPASSDAVSAQLPEQGSKMHYIVQKGDTLSIIAQKIYGDREQWREIQQLTGMENPNLIYPGEVVYYRLTEQSSAFAQAYESTPRGEVTVQAGETLSTIASRVFGDAGQWRSIWRANDGIDNPDQLTVGQVVYFIDSSRVMAQKDSIESEKFAQKVFSEDEIDAIFSQSILTSEASTVDEASSTIALAVKT